MKTVSYCVLDDRELEVIVKEKMGLELELVASEEWGNEQMHDYDGILKTNVEKWDKWKKKDFDDFVGNGKASYGIARLILEFLVSTDVLPEGNFLIECSW